jgi:cell division protein FtsL
MSVDLEYAIKKDIRNNPIVRELDTRQAHEFKRIVGLAACAVAMLLFFVWQHYRMLDYNIAIESLRLSRDTETTVNRKLRLNLETLRAPQRIEARATHELGMVEPASKDTVILQRVTSSTPSGAVMAEAR